MEHPEMRNTAFGEVLAELLEKRGLEVTPFKVGKLAEDAGLDGWALINRMANPNAGFVGYLEGLAGALELTEPEKMKLALAYTFEAAQVDEKTFAEGSWGAFPASSTTSRSCGSSTTSTGPGARPPIPPSSTSWSSATTSRGRC
jgi:hypothetical protein